MAVIIYLGVTGAISHAQQTPPAASPESEVPGQAMGGKVHKGVRVVDKGLQEESRKRQVSITAKDPIVKTTFENFMRELKHDIDRRVYGIGQREGWRIAQEVRVYGKWTDFWSDRDTTRSVRFIDDGTAKVISNIRIHNQLDEDAIRAFLVESFLIEHALEPFLINQMMPTEDSVLVLPLWLRLGFDKSIEHELRGSPSEAFRSLVRGQSEMPLEKVLFTYSLNDLSSVEQDLFVAASAALVKALTGMRGGREGMRDFLHDLITYPDPDVRPLLKRHFPALRETTSGLGKWWALELAALSRQQALEFYGWQESSAMLTAALNVKVYEIIQPNSSPTPKTTPNQRETSPSTKSGAGREGLKRFFNRIKTGKTTPDTTDSSGNILPKPQPGTPSKPIVRTVYQGALRDYLMTYQSVDPKALAECSNRLNHLKVRCFPLYHRVIDQYQQIIAGSTKRRPKDLNEQLRKIEAEHQAIDNAMSRTRDFMNHYEATQTPAKSDEFRRYQKLKREIDALAFPKREDPISLYLDKIEAELY